MGQTVISYQENNESGLNLGDLGNAELYIGKFEDMPWFFEGPVNKMMREQSELTIEIKAYSGTIYQFYLGEYHNRTCMWITSTIEDSAPIFMQFQSIEKSYARVERCSQHKTYIKDAFSGYSSWGKRILRQYDILIAHLEEQGVVFSEDTITKICDELKRRNKKYARIRNTGH